MTTAAQKPLRPLGIVVLGAALAAVSATGRPEPESVALLTGWGLPDLAARVAIYALPPALGVAALLVGRAVTRRMSPTWKWLVYALLGMMVGMVTAWHMELFAGAPGLIEAMNGPLAEAETIEILLWGLGAIYVMLAIMIGLVALFGSTAVSAMQVEDIDPEMLEVRRAERKLYALSAMGMVTPGIACMALAVARQSLPEMRMGPLAVAGVFAIAGMIFNWLVWRGCDELQRRTVINGYAVSAIAATVGAFIWAMASAAGYVGQVDAAAAFVALTIIQTVMTMAATSTMMGKTFSTARPA